MTPKSYRIEFVIVVLKFTPQKPTNKQTLRSKFPVIHFLRKNQHGNYHLELHINLLHNSI